MLKREHFAILSTFTRLPFVIIKTFILPIFEWPFYKRYTVPELIMGSAIRCIDYISLYTVNSEIFVRTLFCETLHMRSFGKIKPSRNGKITLSFIDIGKYCFNCEFFTSLMCLLMHFAKMNFSRKFPNLQ